MYYLGLQREVIASHYLIGIESGPESLPHAHRYTVKLILSGQHLNRDGYLIDLDALAPLVDSCIARYRDRILNELPEFKDRNPSIEALARILWEALAESIPAADLDALEVNVAEDDKGWAAFGKPLG
jgi:6-pyruvoyltetrahydropterin/6-carboxytetrahydropterin synthase